jgi:DNA-binding response OmpR family regulator
LTLIATGGAVLRYGPLVGLDVFLLDWALPDVTRLDVHKQLKAQRQRVAPVLFLTVRDEETDVVAAMDSAAEIPRSRR